LTPPGEYDGSIFIALAMRPAVARSIVATCSATCPRSKVSFCTADIVAFVVVVVQAFLRRRVETEATSTALWMSIGEAKSVN